MGHILYKIFKITLNISKIKRGEKTDNPSMKIMFKITFRIAFKIKTEYYLELLTPETMKLLESTKSKITKDKDGEIVPH